jgi:hypothetical protein
MWLDTPQTGNNGIYWSYLNDNYYENGIALSQENPTLFTAGQDLQFFVLMDDNSFQMTRNSYWGIQQGNISTSFSLSPKFSQYKKIKQCIEDMCNTFNGIDFNISVVIDPTTNLMAKYFNVFYPKQGIDNTDLTFIYPGNIKKMDKPKDAKTMINEIADRGQGSGHNQVIAVWQDAASITAYGLRQDVRDDADVNDAGTLLSIAKEEIRIGGTPLDLPSVVLDGNLDPQLGAYGIGDSIRVQVDKSMKMMNFSNIYRIEQMTVTIDDDDIEEIQLVISLA